MRLVHVQAQCVGEAMGHYERQIFQTLQLALLLVADLQPDGEVTFLQLQSILVRKIFMFCDDV